MNYMNFYSCALFFVIGILTGAMIVVDGVDKAGCIAKNPSAYECVLAYVPVEVVK